MSPKFPDEFHLRVPLLCSAGMDVHGCRQVKRGLPQGKSMYRRPKVENVAGNLAVSVEALKNVLVQVDGERSAAGILLAMYGTGAPKLSWLVPAA